VIWFFQIKDFNFSSAPRRGAFEEHPKLAKLNVLRLGNFLTGPGGAAQRTL
jgi:hypothetical protein